MEKKLKNLKKLKKLKKSNKVLVLGHNALDYKSAIKYPFPGAIEKGMHPPAPSSLLYDNWQDFDGDIISCHHQNYNARFVVAVACVFPKVSFTLPFSPSLVSSLPLSVQ